MKALYITKPHIIEMAERPKPIPKSDEALVRLRRAGVNYIDIYMKGANPVIPIPFPFIPGVEGSGIVEAIGSNVTEVQPGDRVAFVGTLGSYAEYIAVPAQTLIPLPDSINFDQGAAFALQGMTAEYLVHDIYSIKSGSTVLVHAASGGVGLLVVQWLKHLGARVIGTVSTQEKATIAKQAGCDEVIIYTADDFARAALELTHGKGVDYIIDGVGKSTLKQDIEAIRPRGTICYFGLASGKPDPLDIQLLQIKSIALYGGNLMQYISTREELLKRAYSVLDGVLGKWLTLNINVYPLDKGKQALELLENRKSTGKLLLNIRE